MNILDDEAWVSKMYLNEPETLYMDGTRDLHLSNSYRYSYYVGVVVFPSVLVRSKLPP